MYGIFLAVLVVAGLNLLVTMGMHQITRTNSAMHRHRRRFVLDRLVARESAELDREYADLLSR